MTVPRPGAAGRPTSHPVFLLICVVLGLAGTMASAASGESLYRFAPVAAWVKPTSADYDAPLPAGGTPNGKWQLLFDRQINLTADGDDHYTHTAVKVISPSGVDRQSQFNFAVDPTRQTLVIHSLRVIRRGLIVDERQQARITALPQETELRERIYNGRYNINVLLSDVRIGDVVDLEWTIHSRERLFPGHFSEDFSLAWPAPVLRHRLRIISPATRVLHYRMSDGRQIPDPVAHENTRQFVLEQRDIAAVMGDEDSPGWYTASPYLEVSDFTNWADVVQRLVPLFPVEEAMSAELAQVVNDIRAGGGSPAEQALRALRFVQEEIRYVSISIGRGAYQPASPGTVLSRRFGDCKDKSLLLSTILQALGIEAQPALVNTEFGRSLGDFLPTPYTFDHAIVRMKIGDNVYWLDGTAAAQFSPLSPKSPADFERALVIDGTTEGLVRIPRPDTSVHTKRSEVLIDLRNGPGKPGKLQITTYYEGTLADSTRINLADTGAEQRTSDYINYVVRYYPNAKTAQPIRIEDDKANNVIKVTEFYDLTETYTKNDKGNLEFFVQVDELYRYLDKLGSTVRRSPLAVAFPIKVRQTIHVLFAQKRAKRHEVVQINNPAFRYSSAIDYAEEGGVPQMTLDYRYESLSDVVELPQLPAYLADRKRAYDDMGFYLRPVATAPSRAHRSALAPVAHVVIVLSLALGIWVVGRFVLRFDPEPPRVQPTWPTGIRGWLLFIAAVVTVTPLVEVSAFYQWSEFLDVDHWSKLHETVPEPLKPWIQFILLALAVCATCLLVGQVTLIGLFFRKRSSTPLVFIVVCCASAVLPTGIAIFLSVSHLGDHLDSSKTVDLLLGAIVRIGIYTTYMRQSKRVAATFVVRSRNNLRPVNLQADSAAGPV